MTDTRTKHEQSLAWLRNKDRCNRFAIEYMAETATNDEDEAEHLETLLRYILDAPPAQPVAVNLSEWPERIWRWRLDGGIGHSTSEPPHKSCPYVRVDLAHPSAAPRDNTALVRDALSRSRSALESAADALDEAEKRETRKGRKGWRAGAADECRRALAFVQAALASRNTGEA